MAFFLFALFTSKSAMDLKEPSGLAMENVVQAHAEFLKTPYEHNLWLFSLSFFSCEYGTGY